MSNILIATTPADGHVNPMVQVARHLVERGHRVWWYTGKHFREEVERIGARYCPMREGEDFSGLSRDQAFPELEKLEGLRFFEAGMRRIFFEPAPGQMSDLVALLGSLPIDVLVADETCFGAGLAREKTNIPFVWIATSIYFFRSRDTAPLGLALPPSRTYLGRLRNALLAQLTDRVFLPGLRQAADQMRVRVGLQPLRGGVLQNVTLPPDLYLLGTVPAFEYPRSDLLPQTHFVGPFFGAPPEQFDPPAWWHELEHARRPVVHVTQGTVTTNPDSLIVPTILALAHENVLLVVTTSGASVNLPVPLPPNVRIEPYLPHYYLLPHVDVMVTNGGYGGVQMALGHGVPLVVAAATEEKPEVAAHVAWAGVGRRIKAISPSPAQIRTAVRTVLADPAYRRNAQALQAQYKAHNGAARAAELIEALVSRGHDAEHTQQQLVVSQ
jgi:MGT family glycosyltransferase